MDSSMTKPEIKLTRTFKASRALVFKAWTTSEHIQRWFCPNGYSVPAATVEPRVGGRFEVCMRSPEGIEHWMRGRFTEIVPLERLVFDASIPGPSGAPLFDAHTVVLFSGTGPSTQVDVTQTYTIHDPMAQGMIQGASIGWNQTLDRLTAELDRMLGGSTTVRSAAHGTFSLARTYDAPRARVWQALTDASAKAKWFGGPPDKWQLIERTMDVRPGGRERLKGSWNSGMTSTFDALYFDVVPDERLVYAYEMHMDDRKISVSLATLQLTGDGNRTTLTVTEQGAFLDGYDDAGAREHGTGMLLDALGASLKD